MDYINLKDYLNGKRKIDTQKVFIGKTKKTYIVGPLINDKFDEDSFYKRINSSSVCDRKTYKRINKLKAKKIIDKYFNLVADNEMIEIFKDDKIVHHKIIRVAGVNNE